MTEIRHSVKCCQTWAEQGQRFDDDCPACRIMKAGPKLLEVCKALMSIARYYPGDMNPAGDAEIDVAYNLGKVAIAEAEPRKEAQRGIQLNKTHPLAKGLVGYWLMSETKHTPGPWALQRDGNNQPEYIYSTETKQWICQMNRLSQHCILTTEELCRREANADFIVRAPKLLDALRQIAEAESKCCPRCEGNGRLWADGKAHYPSETRDTILCGNCGGSGRLQPDNAQDIARAAIAEAEKQG